MKEVWKPIKGFEGRYAVSHYGVVKSLMCFPHGKKKKRDKILKQSISTSGYFKVSLCKKCKYTQRYVHHLVLEAFACQRPKGFEASHIDGNRFCNYIYNLTWESPLENTRRKKLHGTQTRGEAHGPTKLKESDVLLIKKLYKSGKRQCEIRKLLPSISRGAIYDIVSGKTWAWLK